MVPTPTIHKLVKFTDPCKTFGDIGKVLSRVVPGTYVVGGVVYRAGLQNQFSEVQILYHVFSERKSKWASWTGIAVRRPISAIFQEFVSPVVHYPVG